MVMLVNPTSKNTARTVVLGARGFIGGALTRRLEAEGASVLALGSGDIDLAAPEATERLVARLKPGDTVVFCACLTPDRGRDLATMMRNLAMGRNVAEAMVTAAVDYIVYLSSDAVYADDTARIASDTKAEPGTLYGAMHLAREVMLKASVKAPLGILRATLVYGTADTHNSYGPNRFRRMAEKDGKITLSGGGEEMRDHITISDLVEIVLRMLRQKTRGTLLGATGRSASFAEVAQLVATQFTPRAEIVNLPRQNPITHRHFDVTSTLAAFPEIAFTTLGVGIARVHAELLERR